MKTVSILKDLKFNENKPAVSLLMETDFSKEIRIVFSQGQRMDEHQAPFPITVQVVKGSIDFGVKGEIYTLEMGDIIALPGRVPHDLSANKESVVRLTLSKNDQVKRVESAVG